MPPPYCYDYPRPSVTVDLAIFALSDDGLRVLLIRREHDPCAGLWALPGGFLEIDEPIEAGARRELKEETGFEVPGPITFLGAYGDPGRDPRGRTISLAHVAAVRGLPPGVLGGDDAAEAAWRLARRSGDDPLAFDHDAMLDQALRWLVAGVLDGSVGLDLLPETFDEAEVRSLFSAVVQTTSGVARWLRRMQTARLIEPVEGATKRYRAVR